MASPHRAEDPGLPHPLEGASALGDAALPQGSTGSAAPSPPRPPSAPRGSCTSLSWRALEPGAVCRPTGSWRKAAAPRSSSTQPSGLQTVGPGRPTSGGSAAASALSPCPWPPASASGTLGPNPLRATVAQGTAVGGRVLAGGSGGKPHGGFLEAAAGVQPCHRQSPVGWTGHSTGRKSSIVITATAVIR